MGCKNSIAAAAHEEEELSKHWRLLEKLGEGSYAEVFAVKHKKSNRDAALKILKSCEKDAEADREAKIWKKVGRHVHIVDLIDDFQIFGKKAILMERCDCTLTQYMSTMKVGDEPVVARMLHQMTSAIAHMHSVGIVHRDIKTDNFLCGVDGQMLKLCDFGFARMLPASGKLMGRCGTPLYMSPEMVGNGPHDLKTDVWSLGVICYLMIYGDFPYSPRVRNATTVMQAVASGTPGPRYQGHGYTSPAAKETALKLLHRAASTRISAETALELPFMSSISKCEQAPKETSLKPLSTPDGILGGSLSTCEPCSGVCSEATSEDINATSSGRLVSL